MDRPRHRRDPRISARAALTTFKVLALAGLLVGVVVGGLRTGTPGEDPASASQSYDRVVDRAMAAHECAYSGFGADTVPASALIRTAQGRVRQVSFEVGWDVFNGRRPGTLIAVCLDQPADASLIQVHG